MSKGLTQTNVNSQALGTSNGTVGGSSESASAGVPLGSAGGRIPGVGDWMQLLPFSSRGNGKPSPFTIRKVPDGNGTKYLIYLPEGSFTVDGVFLPANWGGTGVVGDLDSDNLPAWYVLEVSAGSSIYLTMTFPDSSGERTVQLLDNEPTDEDISYSLLVASIDSDGNVNQKTCGPVHLISLTADSKALAFYSRSRLEDNNAKYADQVPEQLEDSQMFLSLSGFFHEWGHPEWFGKDGGFPGYCSMFQDDVPNAHFVVRFVSKDGDIELGYLPFSIVFSYFIHSLSDHLSQIGSDVEPDVNADCLIEHLASNIVESTKDYMVRKYPCIEECANSGDPENPENPENPDDTIRVLTLKSGSDSNIKFTLNGTTSNKVSIPLNNSSEVEIHAYYV